MNARMPTSQELFDSMSETSCMGCYDGTMYLNYNNKGIPEYSCPDCGYKERVKRLQPRKKLSSVKPKRKVNQVTIGGRVIGYSLIRRIP